MNKIKLIYIGTGDIGVPLLQALHEHPGIEVVQVVTGVDKPAGRKMELQTSAIKKLAKELGIEVFQPESIKTPATVEKLKKFETDMILVMAYGQILTQEVLDIAKIDCLNVHTSLLPKYRGASPIQSVLLNGEKETGITLMKMVKKMDAGSIYKQFKILLHSEFETAGSLEIKLSELAAEKVPLALIEIFEGKLKSIEQNEAEATYVTKISKADGQIDWNEPAELIERKIRAFNPWPSAFTFFKGKRLKIMGANAQRIQILGKLEYLSEEEKEDWAGGKPPATIQLKNHELLNHIPTTSKPVGSVINVEEGVGVITGKGILKLTEVQLEGKKPQLIKEFLNGNGDFLHSNLSF